MVTDATPPVPAAAETPQAMPPRRRWPRRVAWGIGGLLASVLLLAAAAIAFAWWALHSDAGSRRLVGWLPSVTVTGARGPLVGDFSAERVEVDLGSAGVLRLDQPRWRQLRIARGRDGRWLQVTMDALDAARVTLRPPARPSPPSNEPSTPPASLRLPLELQVGALSIGELRLDPSPDAVPIRAVRGRVHIGAEQGRVHRFDGVAAERAPLRAGGELRIDADAPFTVVADLRAGPVAGDAWQGQLRARGPLTALQVEAQVRARGVAPAAGASARAAASDVAGSVAALDATATVRPFEPWPLGALAARMRDLDLSRFAPEAPRTSLAGSAEVRTDGLDRPASVRLAVDNARPGRWDAGLLPLRNLAAEVRARPDAPDRIEVVSATAELGSVERPGGSVSGRGEWNAGRLALDATLRALRPDALDTRAPAQRLDGTLRLTGSGLDGDARDVDGRADVAGVATLATSSKPVERPVRLVVDAGWQQRAASHRIEVREASATSGDARAVAKGTLAQAAAGAAWQAKAEARLAGFDPGLWWPSALGGATARLDATAELDLAWAGPAPAAAGRDAADEGWRAALDRVQGQATLAVAGDSRLAGVPLRGEARYARAGREAAQWQAALVADGNRAEAQGRLGASASGDAWQLQLDAPRLDALAPALQALGIGPSTVAPGASRTASPATTAAPDARIAGALRGEARVEGVWPALSTRGRLEGRALAWGAARAERLDARWQLATTAGAPLEAEVALDGVRQGDARIERVEARIDGTAAAHRLVLQVASDALPPPWVDALDQTLRPAAGNASPQPVSAVAAGAAASAAATPASTSGTARVAGARSRLRLEAAGALATAPGAGATGWSGTVQLLEAAPLDRDGGATNPWLLARDLRGRIEWADGPWRASLEPGSARLLGATLRWTQAAWRAATPAEGARPATAMRADVDATLDPLPVAPILHALQPDFGWGGDLKVAGRIVLASAPRPRADVVIERTTGDLDVTDEYGSRQALGLTDLRFGVAAADGVWNFTQAVAGRSLGTAVGALVARTGDPAAWPDARTPISGVVELRVATLGAWGMWVPAGWRLGGELHATASFGGRLGAPEFTGRIDGRQLAARNFVEGVDVKDGELAVSLDGNQARVERFVVKAGRGQAEAEGDMTFGESPTARLRVRLDRFQLLGRVDRRLVASGEATARFAARTLEVGGRLAVDEGLFDFSRSSAPSLDADVQVVRRAGQPDPRLQVAAADRSPPPTPRPAVAAPPMRLALDLRLDLGTALRVRGRGLDTRLGGELRLTAPEGRLAVHGNVRAVDGTYQAYGQRLVIDRGELAFTGDVGNPRLDIEATRPNLDVRVGVAVSGNVLNPRVRLFSEPDMSEVDKLSWLVLGRASDGVGTADTALLQRAALALLAGEGPGATDKLMRALGLDDISFRQSETAGGTRDTVVSLGKQISARWYIGYERSLETTAGSWQLIYRIARRLTVRAQAGGDNAIDLVWTVRWR